MNQAGFRLRALGRLAEAAEPMRASLESYISTQNWMAAAIATGNLSELHLTISELGQALEFGRQSVDLADVSGDAFQRMSKRTTLADVLHQAGRAAEAEALFGEAEEMQMELQAEYPLLYALQGFRYCDLLLGQGKHREVRERAEKFFEWRVQSDSLLSIALDHLALGMAHLARARQEGRGDFSKAAEHLYQAVDGLRQAATQEFIPLGLLARAALHQVRGDFEPARRDLDEVMLIAERGGMGLFQADAHLGYARLYLAMGEAPKARAQLATAKESIGRMGYHRRDGEVAELAGRLEAG